MGEEMLSGEKRRVRCLPSCRTAIFSSSVAGGLFPPLGRDFRIVGPSMEGLRHVSCPIGSRNMLSMKTSALRELPKGANPPHTMVAGSKQSIWSVSCRAMSARSSAFFLSAHKHASAGKPWRKAWQVSRQAPWPVTKPAPENGFRGLTSPRPFERSVVICQNRQFVRTWACVDPLPFLALHPGLAKPPGVPLTTRPRPHNCSVRLME